MSSTPSINQKSRPIANFHPCLWGDHFVNITNPHHDQRVQTEKEQEVNQLKEEVKKELLDTKGKSLRLIDFVEAIERLGVAYHFEEEIEEALKQEYESFNKLCADDDLYHVSTRFRILRQHGFFVPSDVFNKFKDESGSFKESLIGDVPGMLSLYEASHVRIQDDKILDEAFAFSSNHLNSMVKQLTSPLSDEVAHALHQPLHRGVPRVESSHYISIYETKPSHNQTLLKFAKLDFNLLQAMHQKELKELRRWWKTLHLNASFCRDRLTELYFWVVGVYFEPEYAFARKVYRKIKKSTSLLDDTYDAYGTIDELEPLTEMFQRSSWDKSFAEELPEHVKWCYYAMVEACEEAEQDLAQQGTSSCVDYTRGQVRVLCQAYMQEAKWCDQKYVPTYDEYMKVALVTSPYPHATVASFLGMGDIASKDVFEWACQNPMPNVIKAISTIIRLMNDMGGHEFEQKRSHVASAVHCLMERHGMSKEEAYKKLEEEVEDAWKDINQAMLQPYVVPKPILTRIINLARCAHVIYKGTADGYTNVNQTFKDKVASMLSNPIPM